MEKVSMGHRTAACGRPTRRLCGRPRCTSPWYSTCSAPGHMGGSVGNSVGNASTHAMYINQYKWVLG